MKELIYNSNSKESITSLSKYIQGDTKIFLDKDIVHLYTEPIYNADAFYDTEYNISIDTIDEDQLYSINGEKKIYRIQHQIDQFLLKNELFNGLKILDYGCAKGGVMQNLANRNLDIEIFLYDISNQYSKYWESITKVENQFTYKIDEKNNNSFDIVTSFFVLEHVLNPLDILLHCFKLLKEKGLLYIIVPNVYDNIADFILVDHTHHFSENSLVYYLEKAGFTVEEVDNHSHTGAFIVKAKKMSIKGEYSLLSSRTVNDALAIANYWTDLQTKIKEFSLKNTNKKIAIYGAGVYGNYVFTLLENTDNILYFIDQNLFLHHKYIMDKLIIYPEEILDNDMEKMDIILVALNPKTAKKSISEIKEFKSLNIDFYFL
jgi:2-polyprenyl-3-methyl-5-hydroxy-6-metoxy-1,4-benzoquinol methylase